MSLVNKMLRDLDARRVGDGERAALPAAVTPLAAHEEARPLLPILALAGLGAIGLGVAAWYAMQVFGTGQAAVAPASVAPPAIVSVPPAAAPPSEATAAPSVATAAATAAATPVEPVAAPAVAPAEPAKAGVPSAPRPAPAGPLPSLRMADALTIPAPPAATPARPAPAPPAAAAVPPAPTFRPPAGEVASRSAPPAAPKAPEARAEAVIEKQLRVPSAAERAEAEYRRGLAAARQGQGDEAIAMYRAALADQADHAPARQALAAQLIEARRFDEAEDLLRKGTEIASARLPSALALARLQVERNQAGAALDTLLKHAAAGERSADFQGFAGALLNRAGRSGEAIAHYQAATRLAPGDGRWWAGLGIALDAAGKGAEAREAYQKARSLPGLPADLAQHVEQRLR